MCHESVKQPPSIIYFILTAKLCNIINFEQETFFRMLLRNIFGNPLHRFVLTIIIQLLIKTDKKIAQKKNFPSR